MKIITHYFYYNNAKLIDYYSFDTLIEKILTDIKEFIATIEPNIDYSNLIEQWSQLIPIHNQYPNINLRRLINKYGTKFTFGYGGHLRFELVYEKIECVYNDKAIDGINDKACFMNMKTNDMEIDFILNYLTYQDIIRLSFTSKLLYQCIQKYSLMTKQLKLIDQTNYKSNKLDSIQINSLIKGSALLSYFIGKENNYFFIQDQLLFFNIIKQSKNDTTKEELIFKDNWTQYYIRGNKFFQIKYDKSKADINLITKDDEIRYIQIYISSNRVSSKIECFYYYEDTPYFLTKDKVLMKLTQRNKPKSLIDLQSKYIRFIQFQKHCKKWPYDLYYAFIHEFLFISLCSFYIFNIQNKRTLNYFPNIRGVEFVQATIDFFYVKNNKKCFLISKKTNEIIHNIQIAEMSSCLNQGLHSNNYGWNYLDERNITEECQTDYIDYQCNDINANVDGNTIYTKPKQLYDYVAREDLFEVYNDKFLCDYYNNKEFTYVRFYNRSSKLHCFTIQFSNTSFNKHVNEDGNNIHSYNASGKQKVFFNSFGSVIINVGQMYWIYANKSNAADIVNLVKLNRIRLKTTMQFQRYHLIFTDKDLLLWHNSTDCLLHYGLSQENEMKIISIGFEPFFLFHYNHKLIYLITKDCKIKQLIITSTFEVTLTEYRGITLPSDQFGNIFFCTLTKERSHLIIFTIENILILRENNNNYHLKTAIPLIEPGEVYQLRNEQFFVYCKNNKVRYYSISKFLS